MKYNKIYITGGHNIKNNIGTGVIVKRDQEVRDEAKESRILVNEIAKDLYIRYNIMTITDQDKWSLRKVINFLKRNLKNDQLSIEFHFNAFNGNASGTECIVPEDNSKTELKLAHEISKILHTSMNIPIRGGEVTGYTGVKTESQSQHNRIGVLRYPSQGTNVLVEVCFMDNDGDWGSYKLNKEEIVTKLSDIIANFAK